MDAEDRAVDELSVMRLRSKVLRETADHYSELAKLREKGSVHRDHYLGIATDLHIIAAEYAGLTAIRAAELGKSV